jgi:hypothetical protein
MTDIETLNDLEMAQGLLCNAMQTCQQDYIRKDILKAMEYIDLALEHYQKLVAKG